MKLYPHYLFLLLLPLLCTCADGARENVTPEAESPARTEEMIQASIDANSTVVPHEAPNPPAAGFNRAGSDAAAIAVVDSLVKYHGGRDTYDKTRYFKWNFFGARDLVWDKLDKRARITVPKENTVYLLNYGTEPLSGRVRIDGEEVTDEEALTAALQKANSILINDSYWLVHQFKLLDDGVTLKLLPEVATDPLASRPSYVIDQTFAEVGDTPQNKYRLYVDKVTYRINTWQFYRDAADTEPAMQTPWEGYIPYRGLLLSGDRGGRFQLTNISAPPKVLDRQFTDF